MAEQTHSHHHHHHHHKIDGATRFKRNSLRALKRRKIIARWAWYALVATAIIMAIAVVVVYNIQ